eukprot:CAMPEP_0116099246 /NCGR_PEP_ID=MMETSP0327-20121206/11661_1 /TAXON_ID=44447 /ORGANISM="Pseudo-nitzschia delicatissima, Strain B596" /LENGTH=255 /DNA_ID=CAMNT_0003591101 /DNA_START=89 /DNA_END=852 /DNA_ORIENTATION=+
MTTKATPLLGKRKEPPLPSSTPSSSTTKNIVVDEAFKRLFGYSWGTNFNNSSKPSLKEREMIEIFGPTRTARILNLPWEIVAPASAVGSGSSSNYYNPAAMLTTKIVGTESTTSSTLVSSSAATALQRGSKKRRLEEIDYKSIALPKHMVSSSAPSTDSTNTQEQVVSAAASTTTKTKATPATSKLDSVLSQIAGKKQLNTVEKTSNDWEGLKETDKTLKDELERNAQSKNAYLVKQDFLNRVDQRKFELEKEER